jgi:type IV pilus assembly protein PilC
MTSKQVSRFRPRLRSGPHLFSTFYVSMVRAGEESGKVKRRIPLCTWRIILDRDYELHQKIKKALTYPMFVVGTFITIMVGMFIFVIPKMAAMFADNGAELPDGHQDRAWHLQYSSSATGYIRLPLG